MNRLIYLSILIVTQSPFSSNASIMYPDKITISLSGGGIRATIGSLIAKMVMPELFEKSQIYGASGGSWGMTLLEKSFPTESFSKLFKNGDDKLGPKLESGDHYHQWRGEMIRLLNKFDGQDEAMKNPRHHYMVTRTDSNFNTYLDHCEMNMDKINCLKNMLELDASQRPIIRKISSKYTDEGEILKISEAMALSGSAYACGWEHWAMKINTFSKNIAMFQFIGNERENIYLADGGCKINVPIYFVLASMIANHKEDSFGEVLINFDFSYNSNPMLEFKKMKDHVSETKNIFSDRAIKRTNEFRNKIINISNQIQEKSLFHRWQYVRSDRKLIINVPLYGSTFGNELIDRYPTMSGLNAKRWNTAEFSTFIYQWRRYLNEIKSDIYKTINEFQVDVNV
jgi:hypothetical protein